jgi:hypothetical protein
MRLRASLFADDGGAYSKQRGVAAFHLDLGLRCVDYW